MKVVPAPPAPHPNLAAQAVQSCVPTAQVQPAAFKPDRDQQITATVGVNPSPPAVRSAAAEADPVIPYSAGSPVSYAPFGYGMSPW